ncbi:immunoglobulin lambda-1 light chain-like [Excalfactoria chinensis]|uniref:immunoglobulin lambda-1 light chain-like n=1 Tax=Excalfactoria chinensis TaxID=46218 RepID=UPI003B3B3911
MPCSLAGAILLLLLPGAALAKVWIRQSPAQLWVRPGQTAELNCSIDRDWNVDRLRAVNWYREQQDNRLHFIYQGLNSSRLGGKYSVMGRAEGLFSLYINAVQLEDSGFYYCSSTSTSTLSRPEFGDGTRLVVTGAAEPTLSILLPVDVELREPPSSAIPLLCHLYDVPEGWDIIHWHHSNVRHPVTATSMDERGVLSAWSLAWLTAEQWDGTVGCTAMQSSTGRAITVTTSQPSSTAQCLQWLPLVLLPSVLTITIQLMLQLCRKPHNGGPGAPQPPHQCRAPPPPHRAAERSQETEYAEVALRAPSPHVQ